MAEPSLYVYWCPRCKQQTDRPWHLCKRGPALIPQLDEETQCERIEVVPAAERDTLRSELELCRPVVERYGRVWAKDSDYYAAADALGFGDEDGRP